MMKVKNLYYMYRVAEMPNDMKLLQTHAFFLNLLLFKKNKIKSYKKEKMNNDFFEPFRTIQFFSDPDLYVCRKMAGAGCFILCS